MKKLKLRIAKFDRLLVVEQLERTGSFKETAHVCIEGDLFLFADGVDLPEGVEFKRSYTRDFRSNQERDEYTERFIEWITEEQFGGSGKLEIGKPCLVSNDGKNWHKLSCFAGKVAKKLGIDKRFLIKIENEDNKFFRCRFAKPLNSAQPKIDGEFYTWEIE